MSQAPADRPPDEFADFDRRGHAYGRWFRAQQPKAMRDVVAQLIQRKGYAQVRTAGDWREAWQAAAGAAFASVTEVGALRRGTLEVIAANSLVMQELAFEKDRLLAAVQSALPAAGIKQLRFKVGQIG